MLLTKNEKHFSKQNQSHIKMEPCLSYARLPTIFWMWHTFSFRLWYFIVFYCLFIVFYCLLLVFYCLLLYFIVFHCISMYFIVFHCISSHFIVSHCISLYFIVFHWIRYARSRARVHVQTLTLASEQWRDFALALEGLVVWRAPT